jgi:hypothetical protein
MIYQYREYTLLLTTCNLFIYNELSAVCSTVTGFTRSVITVFITSWYNLQICNSAIPLILLTTYYNNNNIVIEIKNNRNRCSKVVVSKKSVTTI